MGLFLLSKRVVLKIKLILFFFLYAGVTYAQDPAFEVNIKEVEINDRYNPKSFIIGYHKQFSMQTNLCSFNNVSEIATFLRTDSSNHLIQQVYASLDFNDPDSLPPIILRLRKALPNGQPGQEIYQEKVYPKEFLKKNIIVINIEDKGIIVNTEGIFVSLALANSKDHDKLKLAMTVKHKNSFTYHLFPANMNWRKTQVMHEPKMPKKPMNGKVGLKVKELF